MVLYLVENGACIPCRVRPVQLPRSRYPKLTCIRQAEEFSVSERVLWPKIYAASRHDSTAYLVRSVWFRISVLKMSNSVGDILDIDN